MTVTLGGIAGLIAALALFALASVGSYLLIRVSSVIDKVGDGVNELTKEGVPILTELRGTVVSLNDELGKVGVVTQDVANLSGHASAVANDAAQLSNLVTTTVAAPLVKVSAFSYAVRRAFASLRKTN